MTSKELWRKADYLERVTRGEGFMPWQAVWKEKRYRFRLHALSQADAMEVSNGTGQWFVLPAVQFRED